MTWGVRFLQEARGPRIDAAVTLAATVPIGWMIGCPLLGSFRTGSAPQTGHHRWHDHASGCAGLGAFEIPASFGSRGRDSLWASLPGPMLPYTVIKEANTAELGGSATA